MMPALLSPNFRSMSTKRSVSFAAKIAIALAVAAGPALAMMTKAAPPSAPHGKYIVVLKDGADADESARDLGSRHGLAVGHVYHAALNGFSAEVPAARLAALMADPSVAFVSEDREVEALDRPDAAGKAGPSAPAQPAQTTPTGIARILANANEGAGMTVAVVDTGIDLTHPDLAANIVANKSCIVGKKNGNDDNGHGTHVAGTIAALDNAIGVVGVAPQAKLVAVKVLNSQGSGSWSSIICGLDWVVANASTYGIDVVNMSLGGGGSSDDDCGNTNGDALHRAICRVRDAGVTVAV